MSIIEIIRDTISIASKIENVGLTNNLIQIQQNMFELVMENQSLKEELRRVAESNNLRDRIVRHRDAFITLSDDEIGVIYCSGCWDSNSKLVQVRIIELGGHICPVCSVYANHTY